MPTLLFHNERLPQVSTCAPELRLSRKCTSVCAGPGLAKMVAALTGIIYTLTKLCKFSSKQKLYCIERS